MNERKIGRLTRRGFLTYSALVLTSCTNKRAIQPTTQSQQEQQSIIESTGLGAVWGVTDMLVVTPALKKLSAPDKPIFDLTEMAYGLEEMGRHNPLSPFLIGPILEETLFRWLPNRWINTANRPDLDNITGFASSVLFGLAHLIPGRAKEGRVQIYRKDRAISAFAGGMFYWRLLKDRGIAHSIASHAAHNIAASVSLSTLFGILREMKYEDLRPIANQSTK